MCSLKCVPWSIWDVLMLKNGSLLIWNSNLTGHLVLLCAESGSPRWRELSGWRYHLAAVGESKTGLKQNPAGNSFQSVKGFLWYQQGLAWAFIIKMTKMDAIDWLVCGVKKQTYLSFLAFKNVKPLCDYNAAKLINFNLFHYSLPVCHIAAIFRWLPKKLSRICALANFLLPNPSSFFFLCGPAGLRGMCMSRVCWAAGPRGEGRPPGEGRTQGDGADWLWPAASSPLRCSFHQF